MLHFDSNSDFELHLYIKIPNLPMIKANKPNVMVSKDTLTPAEKRSGLGSPRASTISNNPITPNNEPKQPTTKDNKLESAAKPIILLDMRWSSFFINALAIKNKDNRKQIKIIYITGPPSVNILPIKRCLIANDKIMILCFKVNFTQIYVKTSLIKLECDQRPFLDWI